MMTLTEKNSWWLEHNKKIVTIKGEKHKLEVTSFRATYPYEHNVIAVYATPINKTSAEYIRIKNILHDDWSTDIFESGDDIYAEVVTQLVNN